MGVATLAVAGGKGCVSIFFFFLLSSWPPTSAAAGGEWPAHQKKFLSASTRRLNKNPVSLCFSLPPNPAKKNPPCSPTA